MTNKTKFFILILVLLAGIAIYIFRTNTQEEQKPIEIGTVESSEKITSVSAMYLSDKDKEASVTYYSNKTASLDLLGTSSERIMFNLAISASGARYENVERGLVLWEKAPELNIYKDDKLIYTGRKFEVVAEERQRKLLTAGEWFWVRTLNGTGPEALSGGIIKPKKAGTFSLKFTADGKVSGKTDCNSFGGTYTLENSKITFGPLASTLMYCENSQESDFIKMLTGSQPSFVYGVIAENILTFENTVSIDFEKSK
jgi:heat shock protein HslJ/membrane-bound inhibitor of C-type lysozyme